MGRVEYGATEEAGKFYSFISIDDGEFGRIIFKTERSLDTLDDARKLSLAAFLALTSEQRNLKYSRDGDA